MQRVGFLEREELQEQLCPKIRTLPSLEIEPIRVFQIVIDESKRFCLDNA